MKIIEAALQPSYSGDHLAKFRALKRPDESGGDTASFSEDALSLAGVDKDSKFTSSTLKSKVGTDDVTFNNATGVVTWGGKKLNLKGIADTLKTDQIAIQKDGTAINVYVGDESFQLKDSGAQEVDPDTGKVKAATKALADDAAMLVINNRNTKATVGGTDNDVIINREVGGNLTAAAGDDTIANFAKSVGTLAGGEGNNALFSVGLTSGTLQAQAAGGEDNSYTKIVSNMLGGTIDMGKGANVLDASGMSLSNTTIKDGGAGAESTAVVAKNVQNSKLTLGAAEAGVDVALLAGEVAFGGGSNSLVADTVKGATITSTGTDSFQFKTLDNSTINSNAATSSSVINITTSAANSEIILGSGLNTINAEGKTLTSMKIEDQTGAATVIKAGALAGNANAMTEIDLKGKAGEENGVIVSKGINYADIKTGVGKGVLEAASVSNSQVTMGEGGSAEQVVTITGALSNSTLTTADGKDEVKVGSVSKSTVALGEGENLMTVNKTADGLTYTGGDDNDDVTVKGALSNSSFTLGKGENSLTAHNGKSGQTVTNTNITAAGDTKITGGAYKSGADSNHITLADGAHEVTFASITNTNNSKLVMSLGKAAGTDAQKLTVSGSVTGLDFTSTDGDDTLSLGNVTNASFTLGAGEDSFTAKNLTNVDITGGAGDKTITAGAYKAGANGNAVTLGDGAHTVELSSIAGTNNSNLSMTLGGATVAKDQSLTVNGKVSNLLYQGAKNDDTIKIGGATANSTFELGDGVNSLTAQNANTTKFQAITNTNIRSGGTGGATTIKAGAYTAGAGGNDISLKGDGSNSMELSSTAGTQNSRLTIDMSGGVDGQEQKLTVNGALKNVTYEGSAGTDTIHSLGAVSNSDFTLGVGEDSFTAKNAANKMQNVSNTNITSAATGKTAIAIGKYTAAAGGNTITLGAGENTVDMTGTAGTGSGRLTIDNSLGGANEQNITVTGAMSAVNYLGAAGDDVFTVNGAISNSDIALGLGENSLIAKNSAGKAQNVTNTNISSAVGAGKTTFEAGAYKTGKAGNTIDLAGTGENMVTLTSITGGKDSMLMMELGKTGTDTQTLNVSGNVSYASVTTGGGDDAVTVGNSGKLTNSTMNLGDGDNVLEIDGTTNGLTYTGGAGDNTVTITSPLSNSNIDLGTGSHTLTVISNAPGTKLLGMTNTNITAAGADDASVTTINAGAYVAGADGNNITLGEGTNTINFDSISGTNGSMLNIDLSTGSADKTQTLKVAGKLANTIYTGAAGADVITSQGAISNSNFDLGAGGNELTAENTTTNKLQALTNVDILASGTDAADITTITAGAYTSGKTGNLISLGEGANVVNLASVASTNGSTLTMRMGTAGSGDQTVNIKGAANRISYFGSKGKDDITFNGTITDSNIHLGEGGNSLTATAIKNGVLTGQMLNNVNLTSEGDTADDKTKLTVGGFKGSGLIDLAGDVNIKLIA